MPRFIALLRGINVGNNSLKMETLREVCEGLGCQGVRTYVQSGNVVFDAPGSPSKWSRIIETALNDHTRLPVSVFVRTAAEWNAIIASNPFLQEKAIDRTRLHVTFLERAPAKAPLAKLSGIAAGNDRCYTSGREVFLHCPDGYGRSKLSNNAIERVLDCRATTRNWNSVIKLHELSAG